MSSRFRRLAISGAILIALLAGAFVFNAALTPLVEGEKFRSMLEKETAKGMHFESAHYAPITRTGLLGIRSDSGEGDKGFKTIQQLQGDNVSGAFNPLGIFLRRWQIQWLHFNRGLVRIQKTAGSPDAKQPPGLPWYLFFWPDRVYLHDVTCDDADVLFQLQGKESGIHHTFLEITPNGRDFEYDAKGGTFTTPASPRLNVEHIHLLVRKPRLWCPELVLGDNPAQPQNQVRVTGEAGLQQDRGIRLHADFVNLQVAPWLPGRLRTGVRGKFSGHFDYKSTGTGLETATAHGQLALSGGALTQLKPIRIYIAATRSPDPGDIPLDLCRADIDLAQGAVTLNNIAIESHGIFRLSGRIETKADKTLSGSLDVGLTGPYLDWLPSLRQDVFTRRDGDYFVTTVHLSGTVQHPQQDISARVTRELARHPFAALKLFFNSNSAGFDD